MVSGTTRLPRDSYNGYFILARLLSYTTMTRTYLGSAILNGATMVDIQGCDDSGRLPGCYVN